MIYTVKEYAKAFPIAGTHISASTIKRMIKTNILPSRCTVHRKGNRYLIEVK